MNNPCPIKIQCGDYPVVNLSSEGPEPFWLPPRGQYWTALGYCDDSTLKQSFSTVSQSDADRLVDEMLATECPSSGEAQSFCADVTCPTGRVLNTICVPTSQSDAETIADSLAQQMLPLCQQFFSEVFCPDGTTSLGKYMSTVSQADADAIAAGFQATLLPFCPGPFYYADARCSNGLYLGTYCSAVSQAEADALAADAVTAFSDLCATFSSTCACPDGVTDVRTVYNPDSQAAADAQCAAIPKNCGPTIPGGDTTAPIPTNGNVPNEEQCCVVFCPDGSQFSFCVPARTFYAQTLLEANTLAYRTACAEAQSNRTCMGNLSPLSLCQDVSATCSVSVTGQGSFSWAVISGSLPNGMFLGIAGPTTAIVFGTPITPGTFTFTLRATNASGSYMQKSFTMHVVGFLTTSPMADGTIAVAYNQNVQATGGSGNYQYTISAGALPDGLSMDAAGHITGTPTTIADYTFTVLVEDSSL